MGIALDSSGAVQAWADQSGSGNDFTQDTAYARPALVAGAGPRGTNVLHFDGVDDVLRNPAQIVAGTSVTIFTVMAVREPGYPWVLGETNFCNTLDNVPRRLFYEGHPGGGVTGPDFFDVAEDCSNDERASFPGINDTQFKVLTITGSDRIYNVRVFVNGAAATMAPTGANLEVRFSPGNTLGYVYGTPDDYAVVDFAEFIVYDRELNQAERESVEAYLMGRYFPQVPQYNFVGFLPPVDNLPVINTAKAGSTIPVKWRLFDSAGAPVTSLTSFTSLTTAPIACDAAPADVIEEVATTGETVLRYDAASGQFIYNWKTEKSWLGCRLLQLTLADGTKNYAKFQLK
jgi:hypothetical protein